MRVNQRQQYIKRWIYPREVRSIPGMADCLIFKNQSESWDILLAAEKAFDKIQHVFISFLKTHKYLGINDNSLLLLFLSKTAAKTIISLVEKEALSFQDQEWDECPLSPVPFDVLLEGQTAIKQEKWKSIRIGKEEIKLSSLSDLIIGLGRASKTNKQNTTGKLLELVSECNKLPRYQEIFKNTIVIPM